MSSDPIESALTPQQIYEKKVRPGEKRLISDELAKLGSVYAAQGRAARIRNELLSRRAGFAGTGVASNMQDALNYNLGTQFNKVYAQRRRDLVDEVNQYRRNEMERELGKQRRAIEKYGQDWHTAQTLMGGLGGAALSFIPYVGTAASQTAMALQNAGGQWIENAHRDKAAELSNMEYKAPDVPTGAPAYDYAKPAATLETLGTRLASRGGQLLNEEDDWELV